MQATTPRGFSADTEILTRRGWLGFDQVTYMDEVATRSPGGEFLWEHPGGIVRQEPYSGEMVRLHGRAIDLLITPNYPVLWMTDARVRYPKRTDAAGDILSRSGRISRNRHAGFTLARSTWDAADIDEVTFPGARHSNKGPRPRDVSMTGDQFAAFMGMYAAEGSATIGGSSGGRDWLISIAQTPGGKGYEEYRALLAGIFGKVPGTSNYGTVWVLHSRALYDYLQPLGKARDKWLPPVVMDMSRRQLQIFWDYYFLGDGNYEVHADASTAAVTATASKQLAGQVQEIVQKIGASAAVREYKTRSTSLVASAGVIYKVRVRATERPSFGASGVPYSGSVGRVCVANEAVYVRRFGKPAWACAS